MKKIKNIKLHSKKIQNQKKILFISDVHLGTNSIKHLLKIVSKINQLDFDMLLIGGDMIDSNSFKMDNLKYFNRILKPIYYVSGNHEYYLLNFEDKFLQLSKFNIKFLNNQALIIDDINLIGVSDNISLNKKVNFIKNNSKNYLLLLPDGTELGLDISSESNLIDFSFYEYFGCNEIKTNAIRVNILSGYNICTLKWKN